MNDWKSSMSSSKSMHRSSTSRQRQRRRRLWVIGWTVVVAGVVAGCTTSNLQAVVLPYFVGRTAPLPVSAPETSRQRIITASSSSSSAAIHDEDLPREGSSVDESASPQSQSKLPPDASSPFLSMPEGVKDTDSTTSTMNDSYQHSANAERQPLQQQSSLHTQRVQIPRIPSVLLAGTQKASTTSLAVYLRDNSNVNACFSDASRGFEGYGKEPHFFDEKVKGGLALYRDLYRHCDSSKSSGNETKNEPLLLDGTPETMLYPERVHQIYQQQGGTAKDTVKIILVLREPASRELSWYNHQLRYATLPKKDRPLWTNSIVDRQGRIKSFIQAQRSTVIRDIQRMQTAKKSGKHKIPTLYGYYAHWLRRWSQLFDRRRQILVLSYDELVSNPDAFLRRVHAFLNVPVVVEANDTLLELPRENTRESLTKSSTTHNTKLPLSSLSSPPPPPSCSHLLELANHFEPLNAELYDFLRRHPGPNMEQAIFPKFVPPCQS